MKSSLSPLDDPGNETHVGADFLEVQVQVHLCLDPPGERDQRDHDEHARGCREHRAPILKA